MNRYYIEKNHARVWPAILMARKLVLLYCDLKKYLNLCPALVHKITVKDERIFAFFFRNKFNVFFNSYFLISTK